MPTGEIGEHFLLVKISVYTVYNGCYTYCLGCYSGPRPLHIYSSYLIIIEYGSTLYVGMVQ